MVLDDIVARKRKDLAELKKKTPVTELISRSEKYSGKRRSFKQALTTGPKPRLICELKKASPSEGLLRSDFEVKEIAKTFEENGACALSVLTEEHYFFGKPEYVKQAKEATKIPVLRKDFIVDPYQVYEASAIDADAFLIIVGIVSDSELKELIKTAGETKLDALVEIHTQEDLKRAVDAGAEIIGINNRNLSTLKTDLRVSEQLLPKIPKKIVKVVESGISGPKEIKHFETLGVDSFLIGTVLMKSKNIKSKILELKG